MLHLCIFLLYNFGSVTERFSVKHFKDQSNKKKQISFSFCVVIYESLKYIKTSASSHFLKIYFSRLTCPPPVRLPFHSPSPRPQPGCAVPYLSMEHQGCQTDSRLLFTAPLRVGLRQGCLLWTGERTYDCGTFLETLPSAGHPGATFPRVTNECSQTPTPSTEQHHGPVARVTPPG